MNILMVSMVNLDFSSPAKEHFMGIAKGFAELGHKVIIITPAFKTKNREPIDKHSKFVFESINFSVAYNNEVARKICLLLFNLLITNKIKKVLKKHKVDIIYIRNMPAGSKVIKISRKFRINNVLEINGLVREDRRASKKMIFVTPVLSRLEKKSLVNANNIICVTKKLAKKVICSYGLNDKIVHFVPNGIDIEYFKRIKPIIYDSRKIILGFAGNFSAWQGTELIPEAIKLLDNEKKEQTKVIMVGDGPMKKTVENLVKDYNLNEIFYFTGHVSQKKYVEYVKSFDICLAPFTGQRVKELGVSPVKIYSYLACRKPVVCSNLEELMFIENNNLGRVFQEGNVKDFSKVLSEMIDKKENLENIGSKGYEYVVEKHNWNFLAGRIIKYVTNSKY